MKKLRILIFVLGSALAVGAPRLVAADQPVATAAVVTALTAADEERMAAIKAGDRARLDAIFSDELRYAHSSGRVDTKATYIESLATKETVYESFDYQERNFLPVSADVAVMSGRVLVHSHNRTQATVLDLNFLAVWRLEHGHWRFLAWQSCKNPPPATK